MSRAKYDLSKAVKLREEGKTYLEISEELGCSEIWCKRNLRGVTKNKRDSDKVPLLVYKARSSEALTKSEIFQMVREDYIKPREGMSDKEVRDEVKRKVENLKTKVIKHSDTIIRPSWMHPERALSSYYKLAELTEALDGYLLDLMQEFFETTGTVRCLETEKSLLLSLVYASKASIILSIDAPNLMHSYEVVAESLVGRNGDKKLLKQEPCESLCKDDEIPH